MIDWRIAKIASSGMRGTRFRLRQRDDEPVGDGGPERGRSLRARRRPRRLSSAAWPVSVEEDVVERRPAQADVVDPDPGVPEPPHDVDELLRAAVRRRSVSLRVCSSSVAAPSGREQLAVACEVVAVVDDDLDALAADLRLQLVGRAARDDPARGRRRRSRPPARRPPRGTASSGAASFPRAPGRGSRPTSRGGCAGRARWSARRGRAACGRPISALARSRRRRMPPE